MANRGVKKKKSNYSDATRIKNKQRKLNKHLKSHPNDLNASSSLKTIKK